MRYNGPLVTFLAEYARFDEATLAFTQMSIATATIDSQHRGAPDRLVPHGGSRP